MALSALLRDLRGHSCLVCTSITKIQGELKDMLSWEYQRDLHLKNTELLPLNGKTQCLVLMATFLLYFDMNFT